MSDPTLTFAEIQAAGLVDWRQLVAVLRARFRTGDFATGLALVQAIGAAAEAANHHPDLTLTYGFVDVTLVSHDAGGITRRDVALAHTISRLAADAGARADIATLTRIEAGLDAVDPDRVGPFWAAMLGSSRRGDDIVDPDGQNLTVWFQRPDAPTPAGQLEQRWHFDVWVPSDQAQERIDAALAAGGTLVDDRFAPSFWVLADADGNRTCICTSATRS